MNQSIKLLSVINLLKILIVIIYLFIYLDFEFVIKYVIKCFHTIGEFELLFTDAFSI